MADPELPQPEKAASRPDPRGDSSEPNHTAEQYADPSWDRGSDEMEQASEQHEFFRTGSMNVGGVAILKFPDIGKRGSEWSDRYLDDIKRAYRQLNGDGEIDYYTEFYANYQPEELEAVARSCVNSARLAFTANKARRVTRNKKAGKLYTPTAGFKLKTGNVNVFGAKDIPDTRDYVVLLGFDISGSTGGPTLLEEKRAVHAQAELLHRLGIKFAIYAHSAFRLRDTSTYNQDVVLLEVKDFNEPWGPEIKTRLKAVQSLANNLDGHTFEVYRKLLMRQQATHRVLLYTTDGAMPAANYDEELEVLTRELQAIRRDPKFIVQAVGQGTDSPKEHGLDTVAVHQSSDLALVVKALQEKLQ
jgi:cobalamin biosynthesis protein CobT